MLKTCSRCGIVPINHVCPYKKTRYKSSGSKSDRFRRTYKWTNKAKEIRNRDYNLCQICIRDKYNTIRRYNYDKLEVHHIVPISEDFSKRLDNDNLITLCAYHHKMADNNEISREELLSYVSPLGSDDKPIELPRPDVPSTNTK